MSFPGLVCLAREYVTPAWDYTYGTPQNAVMMFQQHHPELAGSAADGLDVVLGELTTEDDRYAALDTLDWGFAPEVGVLEPFLRWARDTLRAGSGRAFQAS